MSAGGFKDLVVWQKAKELTVGVYRMSEKGKLASDYGLKDQMRRAAVSVCSNIAEGDERGTDKDSVRFFYMAKGSLAELRSQIAIACEVCLLDSKEAVVIDQQCEQLAHSLGSLIRARSEAPRR
jgi:four helix bundle protein